MSKLSTAVTNLAAKTSKISVSQEIAGGGNRENLNDPDVLLLVTGTGMAYPIRFANATQLNDFIASTGPNGKWPV
jgi:hypothetical protein